MDYRQAIDFLLTFADFERSGRFQERPDVSPMLSLLRRLGDPHLGRPTVQVAGSKGKGTIAAMVESVLRAAGLSTGLYTSPHLHSYCERVRIDGRAIGEEEFARLAGELRAEESGSKPAGGARQLVTFDLLTALAFLAFREHDVDCQVLEVGLGGRLDSTNVFRNKDVCIIAPISLEHTAILGDTVGQITREKAAIITRGCSVVLAPQPYQEAGHIVRESARKAGAAVIDVSQEYRWQMLSHDLRGQDIRIEGPHGATDARLPLLGAHQMENAATAMACIDALRGKGHAVPEEAIVRGLASLSWPGRMEVLHEAPLIVADGAHNRDSARRFREALRHYFSCRRALFIVGASSDKDIDGLAAELAPIAARVFATRSRHPRAMGAGRVVAAFDRAGAEVEERANLAEAVAAAMAAAGRDGVICLVGSLFLVAEGREHLLGVAAQA